jgi:calmodulin
MAGKLTVLEEQFKEVFNQFVGNHGSTITAKELGTVMAKCGRTPSNTELEAMVNKVNSNNDGKINFGEFLVIMQKMGVNEKLYKFDNSDYTRIKEAFSFVDKDGDRFISAKELKQAMKSLGQESTQEDIKRLMEEADTDGDGLINFYEFSMMMKELPNGEITTEIKMVLERERDRNGKMKGAFSVFDKDGDGFISAKELKQAMDSLGEALTEEDERMMKGADTDGDGLINFQEFSKTMKDNSDDADDDSNSDSDWSDGEIKDAFSVFDKDGDGFISATELEQAAESLGKKLTKEDMKEMKAEMKGADTDGDGLVNFQEFSKMFFK